ncbi:endonuclease/exonuclease/phosphatase family protein [Psychrosphaera haliotis]|uniref:Endonuclease/exonuclease/phosphatase n=1 Tax=Psychrosphaera haliotis TaxID=555083 RepID=A0A6N8F642_9GAMM|nr:endonuclease/exonuclease/phosphatase [Psychrosphaera haliotis]MUH72025.1 endonuclease/exonuclease/phosphatase [Psychrosphaera haliotis]
MLLYNLKMAWWNTALSPAARSASTKANTETYATICEHIKKLITELSCDLIAICEVSTEDVAYINTYLNRHLTNLKVLDLTCNIGLTRFDIAVIYNYEKIHLNHKHYLSKPLTGSTVKAAQLVEIVNLDDNKTIQLFLCHWASRLRGDGEKRRQSAATIVYSSALDFMNENKDVIVMGDFNDNPYDESILNNLNATRCHDAVRKYPNEYFYNPFWRTVVSDKKYNHLSDNDTFRSGTHKYKQFQGTIWHSYDQIMFSGSFLGSGSWHLNEQSTKVIDEVGFINDFENKKNLIDHLPVMCEITRP